MHAVRFDYPVCRIGGASESEARTCSEEEGKIIRETPGRRMRLLRHRPALVRAAAAVAGATLLYDKASSCKTSSSSRYQEVPEHFLPQASTPSTPFPGWDSNWDYLRLTPKAVARELGHAWPIEDYGSAIRKLFAEHYLFSPDSKYKSPQDVEKAIERRKGDLPEFYREAFMAHAWGGAPRRHIILVRHGQYEEQREYEKELKAKVGIQQFELDERTLRGEYLRLDARRVLTPLGREQAVVTGDRLAALLRPALTASGREGDVRIHVSTLTRAKETADLISSRLPSHVVRMPPDANLCEGDPALDMPGCSFADGAAIHVEGSRIEAAFRSLFYRGIPRKPTDPAKQTGPWPETPTRHEYEIVVCHMNVIRYFFLRALQLPPEAWLRFGGFNGSISILGIAPLSGRVGATSFGDFGHLSLEQTTFGRRQGLE